MNQDEFIDRIQHLKELLDERYRHTTNPWDTYWGFPSSYPSIHSPPTTPQEKSLDEQFEDWLANL